MSQETNFFLKKEKEACWLRLSTDNNHQDKCMGVDTLRSILQSGDLYKFTAFMELFFWKKAFRDNLQITQANHYHYLLPL